MLVSRLIGITTWAMPEGLCCLSVQMGHALHGEEMNHAYRTVNAVGLVCLGLTGCMNISARLQTDESVQAIYEDSDCVGTFLGMGAGTATVEGAMAHGQLIPVNLNAPFVQIVKVRSVQLTDSGAGLFTTRCLEVQGEAAQVVKR